MLRMYDLGIAPICRCRIASRGFVCRAPASFDDDRHRPRWCTADFVNLGFVSLCELVVEQNRHARSVSLVLDGFGRTDPAEFCVRCEYPAICCGLVAQLGPRVAQQLA